jgi:hypothetical protein
MSDRIENATHNTFVGELDHLQNNTRYFTSDYESGGMKMQPIIHFQSYCIINILLF